MYLLEKLHSDLGGFAYYLLLFVHVRPTNQPAITGVARCNEKFWDLWHIYLPCAGRNCVQHNYTYSQTIVLYVLENLSFLAQMYKTAGSEQLSPYSDSLRIVRSDARESVGARFSVAVHTGRWAHPAICNEGNWVFPGSKAAGAWNLHSIPFSAKVLCLHVRLRGEILHSCL